MPRFFIDTDDAIFSVVDEDGYSLADMNQARHMAIEALRDMARDKIPNGDHHDFLVRIRDESGKVIYTATLKLHGEWSNKS